MKLILLSGGSGQRLWPLSNDSRSKQFLKVLRNEQGNEESMAQRVWRQLETVGLTNSTYITTSKAQVDIIKNQLGEQVPLIVEPERRDTFPAIALATSYLYSVLKVNPTEVICILPVDAYVENTFFQVINKFESVLSESNAPLSLVGVHPSYPSEQYGYIVPVQPHSLKSKTHSYRMVQKFVEKPSEDEAINLIKQHALWNCGIFTFQLGYFMQVLRTKNIPIKYEKLLAEYSQLPKKSFDYEVVEKTEHIAVIPYQGKWNDLGTWSTLTEKIDTPLIGKGMISEDSNNTHLINELEIPVIIAGLQNSIVVSSPDGILVADKSTSGGIKELTKHFKQRPLYEERRWGWYRVLHYNKLEDGREVLTKRIKIAAGKNLSYQMHHKRQEVWIITSGEGELAIEDEVKYIKSGDVIQIPIQTKHGAKAISDLEFIEVQMGSELIEEDIVRIYMTWEEVKRNLKYKNN